jgi:hypothetical protein
VSFNEVVIMRVVDKPELKKVFVKYDKESPHLPVAVADTKKELAEILGITAKSIYCLYCRKNPLYGTVEVEPDMYPDGDGNLWYHDFDTHETVIVRG